MLEFYHNLEIPENVNPVQITLISDHQQDVRVYSYPEGLLNTFITLNEGKTSFYFNHHGPGGWNIIAENEEWKATMSCLIFSLPAEDPMDGVD